MRITTVLASLATLLLVACSSNKPVDPFEGQSAASIYQTGYQAMQKGDYSGAVEAFQGLESHYPFGEYTEAAQMNLIYAHYQTEEYAAAIASADRFIRLHPLNTHLDYVYYLRGLTAFNQGSSVVEQFLPVDPRKRDISNEKSAFLYFNELYQRYPASKYLSDARQRMIYLRDTIAWHELYTAKYYYKRGAYLAAANRAKNVIQYYDKTSAVKSALELMIKAYDKLGLQDLKDNASRVFALNYAKATLKEQS